LFELFNLSFGHIDRKRIIFGAVKWKLLRILSLVLCLAFCLDMVDHYFYQSKPSMEAVEKDGTEKSSDNDVEKDLAKDKIFTGGDLLLLPVFTTEHFDREPSSAISAYCAPPDLPPEMI
jgi:hypothetical protein